MNVIAGIALMIALLALVGFLFLEAGKPPKVKKDE